MQNSSEISVFIKLRLVLITASIEKINVPGFRDLIGQ